ncbi:hypothetical protein [Maricaulis sp.]
MTYTRFVLIAFLSFLALAAVTVGAVRFLSGRLVGGDAAWTSWLLERKEAAAAEIDGPKLFFISGSSGSFGYSAEQLGDALGIDVVNMASHAGLSLPYYAYLATRNAAPGDVVVLPLEYEAFSRTQLTSHTAIVDFERGLSFFNYLGMADRVEYLRVFPVAELLSVAGQFLAGEQFVIPNSGYWRYGVNASGDLLLPEPTRLGALKALDNAREADDRDLRVSRQTAGYLTALRDELNSRGVQLILTQPPLHEFATLSDDAIRGLATELAEQGLEYHLLWNHNRVPAEMMLDSRYHTGASGRRVSTARLALMLCDEVDFAAMSASGETCTSDNLDEQRAWSNSMGTMTGFAQEDAFSRIYYRPGSSAPFRRSGTYRGPEFDVITPVGCSSTLNFQVRADVQGARISVLVNGEQEMTHVFDEMVRNIATRLWTDSIDLPVGDNELVHVQFVADRWSSQTNDASMSFSRLYRETRCG